MRMNECTNQTRWDPSASFPRSSAFGAHRRPASRVPSFPRPRVCAPSPRASPSVVRRAARASSHGLASSAPPTARFDWRAVVIGTRAHLLSPHSSPSPLSLALSRALSLSRSLSLYVVKPRERVCMYVPLSRALSRVCVRPTATVERSAFELDRARETAERRAEDRPRW